MGFAYEPGVTRTNGGDVIDENNAAHFLRTAVEAAIEGRGLDPWCGICKSRDFHYEDAKSIFKTIEEAYPVMKIVEEAQRRTREFLRASRN